MNYRDNVQSFRSMFMVSCTTLALALTSTVFAEDEGTSFDGLERVDDAKVGVAYINPEADFSKFNHVMILEPFVAFRNNWQRDQNRSRSRRVSTRDMDRIKADVAALLLDVFSDRLSEDGGFEIVESAGHDVLLLRPAIIDLDVTAPDTRSAGRSRTFTASTGAATLYIELFDSVSGQIIGRAADRQAVRSGGGQMTWSNSVTNSADARRMVGRWADTLRTFLDSHYSD
jgi:hypothetical protein